MWLGLSTLLISAVSAAQLATATPESVSRFLAANRQYHVLTAKDVTGFWQRDVEKAQQGIAVGDANRDGSIDTCAVLVSEKKKFSVACFQGGREPVWVRKDDTDEILGVVIYPGIVTPLDCYNCDANRQFRWSGSAYESGIRLPGETVCINSGSEILTRPNAKAPVLHRQNDYFGYVRVLALGEKTSNKTRWHQVRLEDDKGNPIRPEVIGYIDSDNFFNDFGC